MGLSNSKSLTDEELKIQYITHLKNKKISYDLDTVKENIKNCTFKSENIYSFMNELSDFIAQFPTTETLPKKKSLRKFKKYVKPQFNLDDIPIVDNMIDNSLIKSDYFYPKDNIPFKDDAFTLEEFNKVESAHPFKKDIVSFNFKLLTLLTDYQKLLLINYYNKMYIHHHHNSIFGITTYIYKDNKKGLVSDFNSFRPIMKIPIIFQYLNKIILNRMYEYIGNNMLIDTQIHKGSMKGENYGIFEQIFKIKTILKDANEKNKKITVLFLDVKNAFGSVKIGKLLQVLARYNFPNNLIKYIENYYRQFIYLDTINGKMSKPKKWGDGLIQGCSLSIMLFTLVMNYITHQINTKYLETMGYSIENCNILLTCYIDDLIITTRDNASMNIVFEELKTIFEDFNLNIQENKCGLFVVGEENTVPGVIKTEHTYLGEIIQANGKSTTSFEKLIRHVFAKLYTIDKRNITDTERVDSFIQLFIPFTKLKLTKLFNITTKQRAHLYYIINKFYQKWSGNKFDTTLLNIQCPVLSTKDQMVKQLAVLHPIANDNINFVTNKVDGKIVLKYEDENGDEDDNESEECEM